MSQVSQWLLIICLLACSVKGTIAQQLPGLFNQEATDFFIDHPAEKVYVHTDREVYTVNDTIWFRIYLTDAHRHTLIPGYQSVYAELVDATGIITARNLILTVNGSGIGDFDLSIHHLKGGKYQLRAYSQYQRNYGDHFIFTKNILVRELTNLQTSIPNGREEVIADNKPNQGPIDLQFLPEGGYMSYGCPSRVAFIARDHKNRPVQVSGRIVDGQGKEVAEFSTLHDGMGKFTFMPEKGNNYTAIPDNHPGMAIPLPEATEKVQLSIHQLGDTVVAIYLWDNQKPSTTQTYYLINSVRGINNFFLPVSMVGFRKQVKLSTTRFLPGINRLMLTDSLMRPIAERLIFVRGSTAALEAKTNKEAYGPREKVDVELQTTSNGLSTMASLSASVVSLSQFVTFEEYPQNILSYLLLGSEFKGKINNPSFYFKDDSLGTTEKLDLVMLTHGWGKYKWDSFADSLPEMRYNKEPGLRLSGKIKKLFWQKGAEDGKVTLFMKSRTGEVFFNETISDSLGLFSFPSAFFPDSVDVFLQGVNKNNRRNIEVVDLATFQPPAPVHFDTLTFNTPGGDNETTFDKMAYLRYADDRAYNPGKYEILLDAIDIIQRVDREKELNNDGHSRIYGTADNVLVVDNKTFASNIWDLISGRIPGVMQNGNSVLLRGREPLFMLDGMTVESDMLSNIPVSDIDKVEVLKSAANLSIFGVRGANGVIAIYTKRGEINYAERYVKGIATDVLRGYYTAREFYSPAYGETSEERPDRRATLFWSPEIITDTNGIARFSFFTSDEKSPFLIRIEGITSDGKPAVCFKTIPGTKQQ